MKLDYLDDISDGGTYPDAEPNQLVRLYDFDESQAAAFRAAIQQSILVDEKSLDLSDLDFIERVNCTLMLHLSGDDLGISTDNNEDFQCYLTKEGYENMVNLLEPFCDAENEGYQWLEDSDSDVWFLISQGGGW